MSPASSAMLPPGRSIREKLFENCSVTELTREVELMLRIGRSVKLNKGQLRRVRALRAEIKGRGAT